MSRGFAAPSLTDWPPDTLTVTARAGAQREGTGSQQGDDPGASDHQGSASRFGNTTLDDSNSIV